jgi:signal transduction histidine kinase
VRNDSDERGAKLMAGSAYWTDYKAEAEVQLLGRGDAGIIIRASDIEEGVDSYSGYYAGLRIDDQALVVGRAEYGWHEFAPVPMPGGVRPNHWYRVTLSAVGCTIEATATDPETGKGTQAKVYDPHCPSAGRFGVRDMGSGGIWRDVRVNAVAGRAAQQGQSQQASASSLYPTNQGGFPRTYGLQRDDEVQKPAVTPTKVLSLTALRLLAVSRPVHASIRGTIILTAPHIYIQDATGGAEVRLGRDYPLKLGDEVEVTGDVHLDGPSLRIEKAAAENISGTAPVPALSITPLQAAIGRYDDMFVELEGRLDSRSQSGGPVVRLDLSGGQQEFYAISNSRETASRFSDLKEGSVLRMRGICQLGSEYTEDKLPFALIVRSPDDVEVLSGPPWWTGEHLALLAVGMLALGFLIHVLYTHADARRRAAVLKERERLAHEMHDTLAQSFAGLDFKLRAIRNRNLMDMQHVDAGRLREELQEASELVRHSHDEARRSLASLRPEVLEKRGLADALSQVGNRMTAGSSMEFTSEIVGVPRTLPVRIADAFFRIGQEAIANAVQHSHARHLRLSIEYQRALLVMVVEDDGEGFSPDENSEGFGLTGMRRRAEGIHAKLRIDTSGYGSRIRVEAPCKAEPFWLFSLGYIRGRARH